MTQNRKTVLGVRTGFVRKWQVDGFYACEMGNFSLMTIITSNTLNLFKHHQRLVCIRIYGYQQNEILVI